MAVAENMIEEAVAKTEDTDECPSSLNCAFGKALKADPGTAESPPQDRQDVCEEALVLDDSSPRSTWKRFVRPLANCIAFGDVELERSMLKQKIVSCASSLDACTRKLREKEARVKLLEGQLETAAQELRSAKTEVESEKRRTSSLSSMLLSDSISQKNLQDQVQLGEESLEQAQQEIGSLSSRLERETEARRRAEAELASEASEAEERTRQLALTSEELRRCSQELQDLRGSLQSSQEKSSFLHGALQEHSRENEDLKERLLQRQLELEQCESRVQQVSSELDETSQKLTETEDGRSALEQRLASTLATTRAQLDAYEERLTSLSASLEAAQLETAVRSKRMEMTSMAAEDFLGHLRVSKARVRHLEEQAEEQAASATQLLEARRLEQEELRQQTKAQTEACEGKLSSLAASLDEEQSRSADLQEELRLRDQQIEELAVTASASRKEVDSLTAERGELSLELARTLAAHEQESEELKAQIQQVNQQVAEYEREAKELHATLNETRLENAQLARGLERRAMEAEEFMGRVRDERAQLAEFEGNLRAVRVSLQTSLADKDGLATELERTCLEREDIAQQLVRAQENLVKLEVEVGNSFLKAAEAAEDSKQAREDSAKEICQWQLTAEMAYRQTEELARQLENWRSQYSDLLKAMQEKQQVIDKLSGELSHARQRLAEVEVIDASELTALKAQLLQSNARLNVLSAAIDLKDTEMEVVSRELIRKGMQTEDYLGQVRNMKDRLTQSEIDLSRCASELTMSQLEKDSLAKDLERKGNYAQGLDGEVQSMKTQLQKCRQETSILDRCLEDKQLQGDILAQQISSKDSEIENLRCELTAMRMSHMEDEKQNEVSLEVLKSTLNEQLHQNELLTAELTQKRFECQAAATESQSLRSQLADAVEDKSEAEGKLEGMRQQAQQLKEELDGSQQEQQRATQGMSALSDLKAELEAKVARLTSICQKQSADKEALSKDLQSSAGSVRQLKSQLEQYHQQLKDQQGKVASLSRSLRQEVQQKEEAAARCAELLCSHPSMCIEAWIGRVRTFRGTDKWQLVAGSGYEERVILRGGDPSENRELAAAETPCIIINAARNRKEKDKREEDKVPVRVYNSKKPGVVTVAAKRASVETMQLNQITVFDKMSKLFKKNRLIYDQNFGVVRPFPDGGGSTYSTSSEASID